MRKRKIIIAVLCVIVAVAGMGAVPVFSAGQYKVNLYQWILSQSSISNHLITGNDVIAELYIGDERITGDHYEVIVDEDGFIRRMGIKHTIDFDQFIESKGENLISEERAKELGIELFRSAFENRLYEENQLIAEVSDYQYYYIDIKEYKANVPTGNNGMIVIAKNGCLISGTFLRSNGSEILSEDYLIPYETAVEIAMKEVTMIPEANSAVINAERTRMNRLDDQYLWEVFVTYTDNRYNQKADVMVRINAENGNVVQIYKNS